MSALPPEPISRRAHKRWALIALVLLLVLLGWALRAWWSSDAQHLRRDANDVRDEPAVQSVQVIEKNRDEPGLNVMIKPGATPEQIVPVLDRLTGFTERKQHATHGHVHLGSATVNVTDDPDNAKDLASTLVALRTVPNATVTLDSDFQERLVIHTDQPRDALPAVEATIRLLHPVPAWYERVGRRLYVATGDIEDVVTVDDELSVKAALGRIAALKSLAPMNPRMAFSTNSIKVRLPGPRSVDDAARALKAAEAGMRIERGGGGKTAYSSVELLDSGVKISGGDDPAAAVRVVKALQEKGFRPGAIATDLSDVDVRVNGADDLVAITSVLRGEAAAPSDASVSVSWQEGEFRGERSELVDLGPRLAAVEKQGFGATWRHDSDGVRVMLVMPGGTPIDFRSAPKAVAAVRSLRWAGTASVTFVDSVRRVRTVTFDSTATGKAGRPEDVVGSEQDDQVLVTGQLVQAWDDTASRP